MVFNVYLRLTSATWSLSTILSSFFSFFLKYFQFSIKFCASLACRVSSTQTLDEISNVCGFSDYSHFYKTFKKETTLSPYEWRKRKQNNTH